MTILQAIFETDCSAKPARLADARESAVSFFRGGESASDVAAQLLLMERFFPLWSEYGDDMAARVVYAAQRLIAC